MTNRTKQGSRHISRQLIEVDNYSAKPTNTTKHLHRKRTHKGKAWQNPSLSTLCRHSTHGGNGNLSLSGKQTNKQPRNCGWNLLCKYTKVYQQTELATTSPPRRLSTEGIFLATVTMPTATTRKGVVATRLEAMDHNYTVTGHIPIITSNEIFTTFEFKVSSLVFLVIPLPILRQFSGWPGEVLQPICRGLNVSFSSSF